jgi:formylglycine-generating enzyme required for sulfatase activity
MPNQSSGETIYGDKVGGDKITVGDLAGSYNAIGAGAQVIVNQIQQAVSATAVLEEASRRAEQALSHAISHKVSHYLSLSQATPAPDSPTRRNPYRALLDYKLEDAPYFYGREEAIQAMWQKMHHGRVTILHSPSGSGKSSLMQAGLSSRLLADGHLPLYLRPYRQPPDQAIKKAFLPDYASQPDLAPLRDEQISLRGFLERVTHYLGERRLYIFLDQFEEFFTQQSQESQQTFAQQLQTCVESDLRVRWVIALRKEYFSDLRLFRPIRPFDNEYFLPTFRPDEAEAVVIEPAARQGVAYAPGLVADILADIGQGQEGISPAHLQLVCFTLFDELELGTSAEISHELYQRKRGRGEGIAGARGILTSHLTRVLDGELSGRERQVANRVLEALVSAEVRRVVRTEGEIAGELAEGDTAVLPTILQTLTSNRLVRQERNEQDEPTYELTHDYLLSEIELNPETQARKAAQELLRQEVAAYERFGTLLSLERYEIIHSQREGLVWDDTAVALLTASQTALQTAQQRELTRSRRFNLALASLAVVLFVALIASLQRPIQNELMRREALRLGPLIRIPVSPNYELGTDTPDPNRNESPRQTLDLPPFQLEKYATSNHRYYLCVQAGVCLQPDDLRPLQDPTLATLPVTNINIFQAQQFCQWLDRRLPTEVEWERGARGPDSWLWPWAEGETAQVTAQDMGNFLGGVGRLTAVDSFPAGQSPEQLYNMAGNIWEWTSSYADNTSYAPTNQSTTQSTTQWQGNLDHSLTRNFILRGISYKNPPDSLLWRTSSLGSFPDEATGFRCASD